jgi:SAM-dependent methyltransferase
MLATIRRLGRIALYPSAKSIPLVRWATTDRIGLEIGGPSDIFRRLGWLPVYHRAQRIDNFVFSQKTVWAEHSARYQIAREPGQSYFGEGRDLPGIPDQSYDFVLSSHVLEHIANPLLAVQNWKRVLKPGGSLILVVPNRNKTFDHRRPVTSFSHMVEDFEQNTGENDLTHLPEILELHDHSGDKNCPDIDDFRERALRNFENRCLHQHTFETETVRQVLIWAGLNVLTMETLRPFHIVSVAQVTT